VSSLTLDAAVRTALTRSERAEEAELDVETAEAGVSKARAAFLPSVSLGANETLRPFPLKQGNKVLLRSNAAGGTLSLNQPLFVATAFPLYASAKHNLDAARFGQTDQRRQLSFDAARGFFSVVTAERVLSAAQSRLELAHATLDDTRARAQAGLVSSNDVTRSELELAGADQSVASANASLESTRYNLEYLLATPVDGELRAPDNSLAPTDLTVTGLVNLAISTRPDLASLRSAAAAAAASADEPGLRFVPTLNASAQERVADAPIAGNRYLDTTVVINFNWQIWDGGVRSADADSRNAAAMTAALQHRALLRRVQADVHVALSELTGARAAWQAAQRGFDAAERSEQETKVLYKQGLAKAIELLNGNSSRFDAEVSLAAAELALRQAELDMRAALGLFPVDGVS
jgi:outer membrane protein TolC